jgi:hypothetical protein
MQTSGARALRADEHETVADREAMLSAEKSLIGEREAMLSAWEQKALIDEFPLRTRRFQRAAERTAPEFRPAPPPERLTVTITGQPNGRADGSRPRRRLAAQQQLVAQPDRVALWAFLLGLFLVVVAAATANAAPL